MISGILGFIIRKMLFYRWVPIVVLFKFKNRRESSPLSMLKTQILIWSQFVASACRLLFSSRPCKDWIKCFTCGAMGHVSRHREAKWKKVHRVDLLPKQAVNQLSMTLERIQLAKSLHAGGPSDSKASILVTLNEASIETGDDLISTALRLGQQNPSSPSVIPSLPLPLPQSL
jgi:hypothetical protein